MKYKNQTALITGSAKRVGADIAEFLSTIGFNIVLHYNNSETEAKIIQEKILRNDVDCKIFKADINNLNETEQLFNYANSKEKISLIINNASIFPKVNFKDTTLEILKQNFNIHLFSPFKLIQMLAEINGSGHVINIIDNAVYHNDTDYFAYLLSKKALLDLTKMTAKDLGPNIRVNGIAPGSIMNPIDSINDDYMQTRALEIPLKIPGNTNYINQGIKYLIENEFVTGQCLVIDGGASLL